MAGEQLLFLQKFRLNQDEATLGRYPLFSRWRYALDPPKDKTVGQ